VYICDEESLYEIEFNVISSEKYKRRKSMLNLNADSVTRTNNKKDLN
jgi:hypothetical protein